jgi:hypothetical protein
LKHPEWGFRGGHVSSIRQLLEMRRLYFSVDGNSAAGCENCGSGTPGQGSGGVVGCGMTMTGDMGGPCPFPSCATTVVATVDEKTNNVTITRFMVVLLRRSGYAALAT